MSRHIILVSTLTLFFYAYLLKNTFRMPSEPDFYCSRLPCFYSHVDTFIRGTSHVSNLNAGLISPKSVKINLSGATFSSQLKVSECLDRYFLNSVQIIVVHPLELYKPRHSHLVNSLAAAKDMCESVDNYWVQLFKAANRFLASESIYFVIQSLLSGYLSSAPSPYELRIRFARHSEMYDYSELSDDLAILIRHHLGRGHRVIIVRSPVSSQYNEYIDKMVEPVDLPGYLEMHGIYSRNLTERCFAETSNYRNYYDPDHLNRQGALRFSQYLSHIVRLSLDRFSWSSHAPGRPKIALEDQDLARDSGIVIAGQDCFNSR